MIYLINKWTPTEGRWSIIDEVLEVSKEHTYKHTYAYTYIQAHTHRFGYTSPRFVIYHLPKTSLQMT